MEIEKLKFTPRIIREIEVESKTTALKLIQDISVISLTLFVKKGLGLKTDEDAFDAIEKYLEKDGDLISLQVTVMQKLQDAGFFPRSLDLGGMKKDLGIAETK